MPDPEATDVAPAGISPPLPAFVPAGFQSTFGLPLAWLAIILGLGMRLWFMTFSQGSNDAVLWKGFAENIQAHGLGWTYENVLIFNHPPLMGYWALLALKSSARLGLRFEQIFKLLPFFADLGTAVLLYRIWEIERRGLFAVAAFALGLSSILVTGHHGNTDSFCVFLCFLAVYLAAQNRHLCAGLMLGAAMNVKLIPMFLIPPLLLHRRSPRDFGRFLGGLATGVIPFVPVLVWHRTAFFRNAISYNSNPSRWGLYAFLDLGAGTAHIATLTQSLRPLFWTYGRWIIAGAVMIVAFFSRHVRRWSLYQIAAATFACFLVFAPGFGVQYTVYVVPFLYAVSLRKGLAYATLSGFFIGLIYFEFWTGTRPYYSFFLGDFALTAVLVGICTWSLLVIYLVDLLFGWPGQPAWGGQDVDGNDSSARSDPEAVQ